MKKVSSRRKEAVASFEEKIAAAQEKNTVLEGKEAYTLRVRVCFYTLDMK